MKYAITLMIIFAAFMFQSCKEKDPEPKQIRQMTLVYAVNDNNLSAALTQNERQMLTAMKTAPEGEYLLLVFKTYFEKNESTGKNEEKAGLFKVVSSPNALEFELVKSYSRDILSTDPMRMSEVISDAIKYGGVLENNLFFWGHGLAWSPWKKDTKSAVKSLSGASAVDAPEMHAYGGDENSTSWMEIDELADAIPNSVFDMIWFDCCYMSNIETAYELRNKCRTLVAYPTEILAAGLPYDRVLPYIMQKKPDLKNAAQALYEYYSGQPVTVSILDMEKIDVVAEAAKRIFQLGIGRPEISDLLNYSRTSSRPFYDFGNLVRETAALNGGSDLLSDFNKAMSNFITFSLASEKDFNGYVFPKEKYTGINSHFYKGDDYVGTDEENRQNEYYRTLGWYKAVFK